MGKATKFAIYGGPRDGHVGKALPSVDQFIYRKPKPENDPTEWRYVRTGKRKFELAGVKTFIKRNADERLDKSLRTVDEKVGRDDGGSPQAE